MQEYWTKFDLLCVELEDDSKQELADELRIAKSYVNGLTDGWYEFLNAFEKTIETHEFNEQSRKLARKLIETLKYRLENK